ncbi:MAG: transglycosylase SLT domain-containing protein [Croceibacterium sp.]
MKHGFGALALAAAPLALAVAAPAGAESSREYFTARIAQDGAPRQLDPAARDYYRQVFAAIDRQDWAGAQGLLDQRDGLLHPVARAELYLAANSPKVELAQVQAWLERGRSLPQAAQLSRLALTRGATSRLDIPVEQAVYANGGVARRTRPAGVDDGTMPAEVSKAILDRITNDDPDGARALLDGVDAVLSPPARAEWRQRVAWSYYIENRDPEALAIARTVSAGTGAWVGEGEWTAGLAAWRLGDCAEAGQSFERAAFNAINPELRTAAYYWASRAALRCRQPEHSTELLRSAARDDQSLYGMLAAEQLGQTLPARLGHGDFSAADWRRLGGIENVRVAVALAEIGRDKLASEVLLHQSRVGPAADYDSLSRLARELSLPSTQLFMAFNAPQGGRADFSAYFPAPKWQPATGWRIDPALAFAHALQESNFRTEAVSPAQAQGLMQITPITVRQHGPRLGLAPAQVNIFDPATNLAFGQQNLEMLRDDPATGGALPKIMAAYNAGLQPVSRWNSEVRDQGDPLLYMESIPYWETRSYVSIVMRNYWMYERQANARSDSRVKLAQNRWPSFPGAASGNGRTYLSAELATNTERN